MRIALGADHAGYDLKECLERELQAAGHVVEDLGTHDEQSVDYPDFALQVAQAVAARRVDFGVLVCGTGIGMSIAANKVPGVRAALCTDGFTARRSRAHNDANVLCIGASVVGSGVAVEILEQFLGTAFDGGRHLARVEKIGAAESRNSAMPVRN